MPKHNIPVYAIVELLMVLAQHNEIIGDYKGHTVRDHDVFVKTSGGTVILDRSLVMKQFSDPEAVTSDELLQALSFFKPLRLRQKTIS
jgi:hypothetical protein